MGHGIRNDYERDYERDYDQKQMGNQNEGAVADVRVRTRQSLGVPRSSSMAPALLYRSRSVPAGSCKAGAMHYFLSGIGAKSPGRPPTAIDRSRKVPPDTQHPALDTRR